MRLSHVLDGVNHGIAPGKGPRLSLVDLRGAAVNRHLHVPIREIDAETVRMPVAWLDLSWRQFHLEDANERILERNRVGVVRRARDRGRPPIDF